MAQLALGKYHATAPTYTDKQEGTLEIDDHGNLKGVAVATTPETAVVLAKASGSADGLGKVSALAASEHVYIRSDCSDQPYSYVDWLVSTTAKTDVTFYGARAIEDEVTLTLASFTDDDTVVINGLTIKGESTATGALFGSRYFSTAGGSDTLDAAELVKLINADYAVVTAGTSVAATDMLTITTDEGAHTITAAAAADYPNGEYGLNVTAATELASIVLAINHKDNVTCATASAADTVTVDNGLGTYVFTGHATTTTAANREWDIANDATAGAAIVTCVNDRDTVTLASAVAQDALTVTEGLNSVTYYGKAGGTEASAHRFSIDTSDTAAALELLTLINADFENVTATQVAGVVTLIPDYGHKVITATVTGGARVVCKAGKGVPGITASLSTATVSFARDSEDYSCTVTSSNATRLAVEVAGGVPGVIAAATGATGELSITPTWTQILTVVEAGDQLTVVDIDVPGIYATSAAAVVTLVPGTPASRTAGDLATVIQATAAARCTVSQAATLLGLQVLDATTGADLAANNTTAGRLFHVAQYGYPYAYCNCYADGTTPTLVVSATPRV